MALTGSDKTEIQNIAKKEMKKFLATSDAHNIVVKIIQRELGTNKISDKIVDLSSKVVVELFKTLWQRKDFWSGAIKRVK